MCPWVRDGASEPRRKLGRRASDVFAHVHVSRDEKFGFWNRCIMRWENTKSCWQK